MQHAMEERHTRLREDKPQRCFFLEFVRGGTDQVRLERQRNQWVSFHKPFIYVVQHATLNRSLNFMRHFHLLKNKRKQNQKKPYHQLSAVTHSRNLLFQQLYFHQFYQPIRQAVQQPQSGLTGIKSQELYYEFLLYRSWLCM